MMPEPDRYLVAEDSVFARLAAGIMDVEGAINRLEQASRRPRTFRRLPALPLSRVDVWMAAGLATGAAGGGGLYVVYRAWGVLVTVILLVCAAPLGWRAGWWLGGRR